MTTQRFTNLFEAVDFLIANFSLSRQEATHFVWDHSFKMGTDKGVWIDTRSLKILWNKMITTSFYKGNSYSKSDAYYEDAEHDDYMTADDYEHKEYYRNGWEESKYDRQYWW